MILDSKLPSGLILRLFISDDDYGVTYSICSIGIAHVISKEEYDALRPLARRIEKGDLNGS